MGKLKVTVYEKPFDSGWTAVTMETVKCLTREEYVKGGVNYITWFKKPRQFKKETQFINLDGIFAFCHTYKRHKIYTIKINTRTSLETFVAR